MSPLEQYEIVHLPEETRYEPIFGQDKLSKIQNNDQRKFQACLEHNIELCIIDVSAFKNFNTTKANNYLDIITNLISMKLMSREGFEPPRSQ